MSDDADGDEDWFESALGSDDASTDSADETSGDSTADGLADPAEDESGDPPEAESADSVSGETGENTAEDGTDDDSPGDSVESASFDGSAGDDPFDGSGGGDPFGGSSEADPFGSSGSADPFESSGTGSDPLGGEQGSTGSDGGLFEDDFADAMDSVGGGDFEHDDFESQIPRLDLGIEGLDNMIQGGVPKRHLIVVVGGAGTGKTTFGLQYLNHGLEKEDTDKGVFITLEQTYDDIMATANESGWEFERHESEGNLAIIDLDPVEMANSLDNIRGELPALIEDFGADRFVLDSVSLLEMMYDDLSERRTEIFDFTQSLKDAGVTTVFTSEANEDNPYASRHGIIEYLTDAVVLLRYVRSETQETRLAVEIQKIRNANHSRETKPYEITTDGISVYEQANIF